MRAPRYTAPASSLVAAAAVCFAHAYVRADDLGACRFREHDRVLTLLGDCTTEQSIVIPGGFTLDGAHHRITARDPAGGRFRGAVIANGGDEAHVRDVMVGASALAPRNGDAPAGILLEDCSGSIVDSQIEGAGIAARASHDTARVLRTVSITGNRVERFGAVGVAIEGMLVANVQLNHVIGLGGVTENIQYGVLMSRGASGSVQWNDVRALSPGRDDAPSVGVRVSRTPGPVDVALNRVEQADVGIALDGAGGVHVADNILCQLGRAGIQIDGRADAATDNRVRNNRVADAPTALVIEGEWARENELHVGPVERVDSDVRELGGAHHNHFVPRE